jgi:RNA polymerase sigma factor (sigma-70 family)
LLGIAYYWFRTSLPAGPLFAEEQVPEPVRSQIELDELNRTYRPALVSFFLRRLRSSADAEDLAQEVLVRVVRSERADIRSAQAYVFRVAVNLLRDRARREKHRLEYCDALAADEEFGVDVLDPSRVVDGEQSLEALAAAIQRLPESTRQIFICYRFENISRQDIATTYQITERAVDGHLAKAMASLIAELRGQNDSHE